jgi:hypothetical protein
MKDYIPSLDEEQDDETLASEISERRRGHLERNF